MHLKCITHEAIWSLCVARPLFTYVQRWKSLAVRELQSCLPNVKRLGKRDTRSTQWHLPVWHRKHKDDGQILVHPCETQPGPTKTWPIAPSRQFIGMRGLWSKQTTATHVFRSRHPPPKSPKSWQTLISPVGFFSKKQKVSPPLHFPPRYMCVRRVLFRITFYPFWHWTPK